MGRAVEVSSSKEIVGQATVIKTKLEKRRLPKKLVETLGGRKKKLFQLVLQQHGEATELALQAKRTGRPEHLARAHAALKKVEQTYAAYERA